MYNRKKLILALSVIFILGFVTGAAVMPLVMHELAGNPYISNKIAKRVFNTEYLEKCNLNDSQKLQIDALIEKYMEEYKNERELFSEKRASFYKGFVEDLKTVLTPEQYDTFRKYSDKDMKERDEWHKKMRDEGKNKKN